MLDRNFLEGAYSGKISAPVGIQFIATSFVAPLSRDCWFSPPKRSFHRNQSSLAKKYYIVFAKIQDSPHLPVQMPLVDLEKKMRRGRGIFISGQKRAANPCIDALHPRSCNYVLEKRFHFDKRRILMAKTIKWEKDFDRVLTLARAEKKMVLLDFFNPL